MNTPKKNKNHRSNLGNNQKNDRGLSVGKGLLIDNADEIFAGGITLDLRKIIR